MADGDAWSGWQEAPQAQAYGASPPATTQLGSKSDQWSGWEEAPQTVSSAQPEGRKPSLTSIGTQFGAGGTQEIANIAGAPVDLASAAMRNSEFPEPPADYRQRHPQAAAFLDAMKFQNPVGGSNWISQQLGKLGVGPGAVGEPQNAAERVAKSVGGAVASVPLMGMAGAAAGAPSLAPATVSSLAKTVGATAGGALTGQVASEYAPDDYKGYVNLGGNLLGGLATAGAIEGGTALANAGAKAARPFYAGGQQRMAGEKLLNAASDPNAVRNVLSGDNEPLVPGSQPTTFQVTQDQGLGQLERWANKPADAFLAREAKNNVARNQAVENLAPTGNAEDVGNHFRAQLAAIDAAGNAAETQASSVVQGKTEALGGQGTPSEAGQAIRSDLSKRNLTAKGAESRLWNAINPDGKAGLDVTPFKDQVQQTVDNVGSLAQKIEGPEAQIVSDIQNMEPVTSLNDIRDLRSRLSTAISERVRAVGSGEDQIVRRLKGYQGALDDTLTDAVNRQSVAENQAVQAGNLAPQGTTEGRLRNFDSQWQNQPNAVAAEGNTGRVATTALAGEAGSGARPVPGVAGAGSQAPGGLRSPAGNPSVSSGARIRNPETGQITPIRPLSEDELDRYGQARQATAERKSTFRSGPVGQVLKAGQNNGFALQPSDVGAQVWKAGPQGEDAVRSYMRATNGDPKAISNLQDYAVSSLRDGGIIKEDGTIDPKKYDKWALRFNGALKALPEIDIPLSDARSAQELVDNVSAAHKQALTDYQKGVAEDFLKDDPLVAVKKAFGSGNSPETFAKLSQAVKGNSDAETGLKRAVVDYIQQNFRSTNKGVGTDTPTYNSASLQKFIRDNKRALRTIFGGQGLQNLEMVSADLNRANMSIAGTKLPGGSNSPQDLALAAAHGPVKSILSHLINRLPTIGAIIGSHGGMEGSAVGATLAEIPHIASAMRQAGIAKADDLVKEAMLNPELARDLIRKVPPNPSPSFWRRTAITMRSALAPIAMNQATNPP